MRKVRCIRPLYLDITVGKVYDIIDYEYHNELITYTIEILNDENLIMVHQMKVRNASDIMVDVFEDVSIEYRDEIIDEILS